MCSDWLLKPPVNLSALRLPNGQILVRWRAPRIDYAAKPVLHYAVEYRTVGRWVPLIGRLPASRKSYLWTTPSRGTTYQFRVIGYYGRNELSQPSATVTVYTGGWSLNSSSRVGSGWIESSLCRVGRVQSTGRVDCLKNCLRFKQ